MTTQPDQQPAEFAAFLVGHLNGRTHEEIGTELHQLLDAVRTHGKKGSLTITVVVEPPSNGVDGGPLPIGIEYATKAPRPAAPKAIYFLDADGNPTRNDPRQVAFDFRTAPANDETLRSI
ncbi:hypothetical protein BX265_4992 [Streptomyces sp. TLI_235]|nr:hypothetical protein [Streptomyces sp. TLI_235]PBC80156.1 hypothetical protein BX265_4992 [Streptomyces sp. TLI_235]